MDYVDFLIAMIDHLKNMEQVSLVQIGFLVRGRMTLQL